MTKRFSRKAALLILDGWGINPRAEGNVLKMARTPFFDSLFERYPHTALQTCGLAVGLPDGQMGNSEVGHMNIGSGRIIYQDFTRINRAIETGELAGLPALTGSLRAARDRNASLHLFGLVSDGGVHSHISHLLALLDAAGAAGLEHVWVHAVTDGRDTSPTEGLGYLRQLLAHMRERGTGRLATVSGRYYAMDRDKRWDRVERAYRALVHREGRATSDAERTVQEAYAAGETDEFLLPTVVDGADGRIRDGDLVLCFNFRADRVRQMTRALTQQGFDEFPVEPFPGLAYVCMTQYDATFELPVLFPPTRPDRLLGQVVSESGGRQLRIAETEKYAHVTYFFNGGEEKPFEGEKRVLIPSPRVATYDLKPEMSAPELTDELIASLGKDDYDLVICNYANCDMVGHTGIIPAAVRAVETLDGLLGKLFPMLEARGFTVFLSADHGNIEQMVNYETGEPFTEHTLFPVPLLVTDSSVRLRQRPGKLADIAPTVLAYAGAEIPSKMEGDVLLE
ncbi:MAG: 2,3-bisphosphoglycerate-independent phosphoglycerate mutase [Candidatus Wallbacteria bacterium]|nr:2,3-bisphosphoglycerate-independent phosphoglycerate mutase [Candidatus Wallbacteria bacterium]